MAPTISDEVQAPEGYLLGGEDIQFVVDQEYQWDNPLTSPVCGCSGDGADRNR